MAGEEKPAPPPFEAVPAVEGARWCRVEVMGHRSHDGRVTEVERFGSKMCRVEVFCRDGHLVVTAEYGGAALFGVHDLPGSEGQARKASGITACPHPDHAAEKAAERSRYALPEYDDEPDDEPDDDLRF